jgi:hypothetical protein
VSIRYTLRLGVILDAREILVLPNGRNRGQHFGQSTLSRSAQRLCQDLPMLRFCTAAVSCRLALQRLYESLIDATYDQVGHATPRRSADAINDSTLPYSGDPGTP